MVEEREMVLERFDDQVDSFDDANQKPEQMVMPYEHGCIIFRGSSTSFRVRHKRFPNRHWETNDLNTARMICDELNCE